MSNELIDMVGAQEQEQEQAQGSAEDDEQPREDPLPEMPQPELAPEYRYLKQFFGMLVCVQLKSPLWKVQPEGAIPVQMRLPNGDTAVQCLAKPVLWKDTQNPEGRAEDVFECVNLQPAHGGRILMLQAVATPNRGMGKVMYCLDPAEIRCVSQAIPSPEEAEMEMRELRRQAASEPLIEIPGAPNNEPGRIIT